MQHSKCAQILMTLLPLLVSTIRLRKDCWLTYVAYRKAPAVKEKGMIDEG